MSEKDMAVEIGTLTVFANSPDRGQGLARDMTVRWALAELDQPYQVRTVPLADLRKSAHLARNPFGQIPTWEDSTVAMFESAAVVIHLAESHERLMPRDLGARARVLSWSIAAVATIEPAIVQVESAHRAYRRQPWREAALETFVDQQHERLGALSRVMSDREWLEGRFSCADLLMVQALRRLEGTEHLQVWPALRAWMDRCIARPAFQRAFTAQRDTWIATSAISP